MTVTPDRVVVISDFSTSKGGASKLAGLLATLLFDRGHPVTFFAGDQRSEISAGKFDQVNLGSSALLTGSPLKAALSGIWNKHANQQLTAWIEANDTPRTVYHVHGFLQTLSPSIFAALHHVRQRVVVHAHDYFLACPNGAFFDYRKGETCERAPMSRACITCNCDKRSYPQKLWRVARQSALNSTLAEFRKDATFVMLHERMTDFLHRTATFTNCPTIANPAEPYLDTPINAERNQWFCYVGDIHDYKGVFLFAEAAKQAGLTAHFIGDGQDAADLKNQYPEAVYHGWQDSVGLRELLANARAVVVPSRGPEPFGLSCVEAMLSGIPVIASDSILLSDAIEQHKGGIAFKSGSAKSLADKVKEFASNDSFVADLSQNAPKAAASLSCTPENWVQQIVDTYIQVLDRSNVNGSSKTVSEPKSINAC